MRKRICLHWLPLLILVFFLFKSAASAANTINIGVVGAMNYTYGKEIWNGAIMAADEINKRGGVRVGQRRMRMKLTKANTNEFLNVQYATNTMEMLFFRNDVDFVVGGFRSEAVLAMQDVAMDYKKIFISVGAALPELCRRVAQNYDRYKYYFRGGTFNSNYLAKGCFLQINYVAQILRRELGIKTIKIAIATEKTSWVEAMISAAEKHFPEMGLELVGIFRSSPIATDVSTEIKSIAATHAPLVLTLYSSNVGTTFVTQAADMGLPSLLIGINVEAQRNSFWKTTGGKANYSISSASYCKGVEMNKLTKPFVENYMRRFGELPTMTAESYSAIAYTLVPAIEQAGSLDQDMIVNIIENKEYPTPRGIWAYDKDALGRPLHDLKFGAQYALMLGIQWIDGEMKGIWPNDYIESPGAAPLTYKGIVDLKIPPVVQAKYKMK